ncbi:MAG: redoxin domain-containing protein [Chitinophagaceae bacterium]|nr:redoxin domain-containing protein [Chitinophagaceae bacterium]
MKKRPLLLVSLIISITTLSQTDSIQPPYKKFPNFPPVKLLLVDSTTGTIKDDLPKKKAVMLMLFSPDCDHCQHETEEIVKNIEKFEKVTIVMITTRPYADMMAFRERYGLAQYKNIIMGQDPQFFLFSFYNVRNLPFLAFYDKKGELISVFAGSMPMEKVLIELEK